MCSLLAMQGSELLAQNSLDTSLYETPEGYIKKGTVVYVMIDSNSEVPAVVVEMESKDRYVLSEIGGAHLGVCWREFIRISPDQDMNSLKQLTDSDGPEKKLNQNEVTPNLSQKNNN